MPSAFYNSNLAALRAEHPEAELSDVTYQVNAEFFAAQKEIETAEELKGFTSVIVVAKNGKIVLGRKSHGMPGWSLPGGAVEADESFAAAAAREIFEEVGIRLEDLTLLLIEEETFLSPAGEKAHSLLGVFAGSMGKFALPPQTEGAREEGLELALFDPADLPEEMTLTDRDKIAAFFAEDEDDDDSAA